MTHKKPNARVTDKKRVFNGFFKVDEYRINVDKHDGSGTFDVMRLVFERGHAVSILAYDPHLDKVLLINEMRPGILAAGEYPFSDALPAGMIDKGEDAVTAAVREMKEETGLDLKDPILIHPGAYVSAGGTSEKIAIVFGVIDASKAGGIHGHAHEGEDILSVLVSSQDLIERASKGDLKDLKGVAAAFWLACNKDRLKLQYASTKTKAPDFKP